MTPFERARNVIEYAALDKAKMREAIEMFELDNYPEVRMTLRAKQIYHAILDNHPHAEKFFEMFLTINRIILKRGIHGNKHHR